VTRAVSPTADGHEHAEYAHVHGQFRCTCGAVRLGTHGVWATPRASARLRAAAERATGRLMGAHGTAVDAYGQRLAE